MNGQKKKISIGFSDEEYAELKQAAQREILPLSVYLRSVLLKSVRKEN